MGRLGQVGRSAAEPTRKEGSSFVTDDIVKKTTYVPGSGPADGGPGAALLSLDDAAAGAARSVGSRRALVTLAGDVSALCHRDARRRGVAPRGVARPCPRAGAHRVRRDPSAPAHHRTDRALDHLRDVWLRPVPQLGAQHQRLGPLRGAARPDRAVGGGLERSRAHAAGRGVDRFTGLHRGVLGRARSSRCPPAAPSGERRSGSLRVFRSAR